MSLNESIVEDAALEWFGELGYAVGHGPQLALGESAAARHSFDEVVLVGRLREAIRRLEPTVSLTRIPAWRSTRGCPGCPAWSQALRGSRVSGSPSHD
jgi:hypothetical protein